MFPLDRSGPAQGFILLTQPPLFDLKDPEWLKNWEAFYEAFKLRCPPAFPKIKADLTGLISSSARMASQGRQLLLRTPLYGLLEKILTVPDAPGFTSTDDLLTYLSPLVHPRGNVSFSDNSVFFLFQLPDGVDPQLYVSQWEDFLFRTFRLVTLPELTVTILSEPWHPGEHQF